MALVACFLTFNVVLLGIYFRQQWQRARQENPPPRATRLSKAELYSFGLRQIFFVTFLAFSHLQGDWTAASVGFHGREYWLYSVLAGELAYLGLALVYALMLRLAGKFAFMRQTAMRGNLRIWPRGRTQKWLAALFIMGFNPFTEEIVMRGVLIHHWGLAIGSPVIPIIVGFVLNGALHWYQGWRMQLWHAMFFTVAVSLLYSSFGLTAAITAHVFGDVMPIVQLRRQQKAARRARHAALKAQCA